MDGLVIFEVDIDSGHGDSGAGFFRITPGPRNDAFGILSFGAPGYTYYYAWDQAFSLLTQA